MYGHPAFSGHGSEKIDSIESLVTSLKRRQLLRPHGRFLLTMQNRKVNVNLLPNDFIEFDGEVPPLAVERQLEGEFATTHAYLNDDVNY